MLVSRCRCLIAAVLSLSSGFIQEAVAQNAGQNCGCAKSTHGAVPQVAMHQKANHHPVAAPVSMPLAFGPMASGPSMCNGKQHDPKHHHHANPTTGLFPGQTTAWAMPGQANPLMTPIAQQNQLYQFQPLANQPVFGTLTPIAPMAPGYGQAITTTFNPFQPGPGQANMTGFNPMLVEMIPVGGPTGFQMPLSPMTGPNPTGNWQLQQPQMATPWVMQPGLIATQMPTGNALATGTSSPCHCKKQGMAPGQLVSTQSPAFGTQNPIAAQLTASMNAQKSCTPHQGHGQQNQTAHNVHVKKK